MLHYSGIKVQFAASRIHTNVILTVYSIELALNAIYTLIKQHNHSIRYAVHLCSYNYINGMKDKEVQN